MKIGDYDGEWVANQTPARLGWKIGGAVAAVVAICMIGGFVFGWFNTLLGIGSAPHVQKEWDFVYTYQKAWEGAAQNWCSIKTAEDEATDPDVQQQRVSQRLAIEMNYHSQIEAAYNQEVANAFKAGLVKPLGAPTVAPTLAEEVRALSLSCGKTGNATP